VGFCAGMYDEQMQYLAVTALLAREQLSALEAEQALAVITGLSETKSYMRDLDDELETWRYLYVSSAVTEIATLRAMLDAPQVG
jgi:hypothetical protein